MKRGLLRVGGAALIGAASACQLFLSTSEDPRSSTASDAGVERAPDGASPEAAAGDAAGTTLPKNLELLAQGQAGPRSLALGPDYAYWANTQGMTIGIYRKDAGASVFDSGVAPSNGHAHAPVYVVADSTSVFWAMPTAGDSVPGIRQARADGGQAIDVVNSQDVVADFLGFAQGGPTLYWSTGLAYVAVETVAKAGGEVRALAGGHLGTDAALGRRPGAVVATPNAVFWASPSEGIVSRYALADGSVVEQAVAENVGLRGLAADDAYVYYLAGTSVWRTAATLDGTPEAIATAQGDAVELTTYDHAVYWTFAAGVDDGVRRATAPGGEVDALVTAQPGARSIAVDASGVYFTRDDGAVFRLVP